MPKKDRKKGSTSTATRILIAIIVIGMVLPMVGTVLAMLF